MKTVRINKGDLVNALTQNRKQHKADYVNACHGYRVDMLALLHNYAVKLEEGENVAIIIRDSPPTDHSDEYDVALKMLEMSVDTTIELTEEDFRHMVLDDWEWQRHWKASNSKYLGK